MGSLKTPRTVGIFIHFIKNKKFWKHIANYGNGAKNSRFGNGTGGLTGFVNEKLQEEYDKFTNAIAKIGKDIANS